MSTEHQPGAQTLIRGARTGDKEAFEQLLARYHNFIGAVLRRNGIDDTGLKTTEDLEQSVAFILWLGFARPEKVSARGRAFFDAVTDAGSFRRLVARVALCRCLKAFRYESAKCRRGTARDQDFPVTGDQPLTATLSNHSPDPADEALGHLTVDEIRGELDRLLPGAAAVFDDYLNGLSPADSASRNRLEKRTLERYRQMIRRFLTERFERDVGEMGDPPTP